MMEKPMRTQTADPNRMKCRDCLFRDKTVLTVEGKKVQIGIMRDTCLVFDGKRGGNWKPSDIYFLNADCPLYDQDETAPKFWEE